MNLMTVPSHWKDPGDRRPLVLHVVYRFDTGGLENGIVNLINNMPAHAYRHAVLALTEVAPHFSQRVQRGDVEYIALHKPPGHAISLYPRVFRLLRMLRPAIIHTRNLAALEMTVPAWAARVPVRIHGEHGRDVDDPDGQSRRHQLVRRLYRPFVSRYIALSRDLAGYLIDKVRVSAHDVAQIYNGVDSSRFRPARGIERPTGCPFDSDDTWIIGTVGRMAEVKNQLLLAQAFVLALQQRPDLRGRLRLAMIGDGPLRAQAQAVVDAAGMADLCWLPGERADVPEVMRAFSCFALPSLAEGVSNTILEAMATGLPVVATAVGGNAELVNGGVTGYIVPPADTPAMARALVQLADDPAVAAGQGQAGRAEVERRFSLPAMVAAYQRQYDEALGSRN